MGGVAIRTVRMGAGVGPNRVRNAVGHGFVASAVRAGFPMAARADCDTARLYVAVISEAPPGSRWCDEDLAPGDVVIYGPGRRHTAVNPAGISFAFCSIEVEEMDRTADGMDLTAAVPGAGTMTVVRDSRADLLRRVVPAVVDPAASTPRPPGELIPSVVTTMAAATGASPSCRRLDNGALVGSCLDFAERVHRVPSVDELCRETFVCRRKLWEAFDERYGMSPARFLRAWGLSQAWERLRLADPSSTSVLDVATDLGFQHAGRFASRYQRMFGERPSETLHRPRPRGR